MVGLSINQFWYSISKGGFHKWGYTHSWMVYNMDDDWGYPYFHTGNFGIVMMIMIYCNGYASYFIIMDGIPHYYQIEIMLLKINGWIV